MMVKNFGFVMTLTGKKLELNNNTNEEHIMIQRLQGYDFQVMRPYLEIIGWSKSNNDHIRVDFKDKRKYYQRYCHWLNDVEQTKFELVKNNYKVIPPKVRHQDGQSL